MSTSLAPVMLALAGQAFILIGQAISLVAIIHLGEISFTSARMILDMIPKIVNPSSIVATTHQKIEGEQTFAEYASAQSKKTAKLLLVIVAGIAVKYVGGHIQGDSLSSFLVKITS